MSFSGMSVVFDRRFGFMNKALSTPVGRGTIVMGKVFQSVAKHFGEKRLFAVFDSHFDALKDRGAAGQGLVC